MEDEQAYGRIDQEEIDKLLAEPSDINYKKNSNPTNNDDPLSDDGNNDTDEVPGKRTSVSPTITQTEPYRWTYSQKQTTKPKKVKFYDEEWHKLEVCHRLKKTQLSPNPKEDRDYTPQIPIVMAFVMNNINNMTMDEGASFSQQYILQKGLKKFRDWRSKAAAKEMDQLHQGNCFTNIYVAELILQDKGKDMEALMCLNDKRDNYIDGRMVYNWKPTQEWSSIEYFSIPTAEL